MGAMPPNTHIRARVIRSTGRRPNLSPTKPLRVHGRRRRDRVRVGATATVTGTARVVLTVPDIVVVRIKGTITADMAATVTASVSVMLQ